MLIPCNLIFIMATVYGQIIYIIVFDIVIQFKQCIVLYIKNEWFCAVNFVSIEFLIPKNLGLDTNICLLSLMIEKLWDIYDRGHSLLEANLFLTCKAFFSRVPKWHLVDSCSRNVIVPESTLSIIYVNQDLGTGGYFLDVLHNLTYNRLQILIKGF